MKNSAVGLVAVFIDANGEYYLKDRATQEEVENCAYQLVFKNGKLLVDDNITNIRARFHKEVLKAIK